MHTLDVNSSNVPAFLIKLWRLVEDPSCDDLIAWSDSGVSFIIKDQARFARELLPQYFKHNNMASFVRQLNMYGFRKVMNYEKSGLRNENNEMEFQHSFFVKEQMELLELIKRKIPNTRIVAEPHVKSNAKDILTDLTTIRDKQESMDNMLLKMKQENELLWKELTNMRQKHKQQEQVIEKVIHFLVQIMRNQPVGVGLQRKMPRMLHDSPGSKGSTSQITTVDLLRKNPECIIVQDKNSSGPVIHEVTDFEVEEPQSVDSANSPAISVKSPAAKLSSKSPASSIISVSPAVRSPAAKSPANDSEQGNHIDEYPLESSSLNSPIDSAVPLEPLPILEPLHSRTPVMNEDDAVEESVLGIPLEYVTASDVAAVLNSDLSNNIITIPKSNIVENVISIPEESNISNVISIPEGTNISSVISIPEGSNISSIITVPSNQSKKSIKASSSVANNVISVSDVAVENAASGKSENLLSVPDFYDTAVCLKDLKTNSTNVQSSANSALSKHDFIDPLMSDSLNTPKVNLTDDIDLVDFTVGDSMKKFQNSSTNDLTPSMNITQREHNYPASSSDSSKQAKSSTAKNTLSNHLLIVDEELNRLQDDIATNSWDVDVDKILGLFSSDGMVSNESLVEQFTDSMTIKKEPEDVLDSELVQLTPQMLGVELDELRSPFFSQLDSEIVSSNNVDDELSLQKPDDTGDQEILPADFFSNDNDLNNSSNKRSKNSKSPRGKRRKLK